MTFLLPPLLPTVDSTQSSQHDPVNKYDKLHHFSAQNSPLSSHITQSQCSCSGFQRIWKIHPPLCLPFPFSSTQLRCLWALRWMPTGTLHLLCLQPGTIFPQYAHGRLLSHFLVFPQASPFQRGFPQPSSLKFIPSVHSLATFSVAFSAIAHFIIWHTTHLTYLFAFIVRFLTAPPLECGLHNRGALECFVHSCNLST